MDELFDIPINIKGVKGDKGDAGKDGANGKDGRNGLDGRDGKDGLDGLAGEKGERGNNGLDGRDGLDGKSAYQLWLSLGNKGSVEDFILSLCGDDGFSAYDIWLNDGHSGSEADFLGWLKGKDGVGTYQNVGMSVPDIAGQVGRLKSKAAVLATDDFMIQRAGSLFRISITDFISTSGNYVIKSEDYNLVLADYYVEMDTASTTATLLSIGISAGKECHVDNSSVGVVYVTPVGALAETLILTPCEGSYFVYNGTHWRIK